MGGGRTVFEILRTEQDPAADAALLAALPEADLATATAVVETLLTRNTREALLGLIQVFHLLDETLKQMVLIEWERLFGFLREAAQARADQVRINMLEIIRRACVYRASYLAESCLRHRSANLRQAAVGTLTFLADELLRTAPGPVSKEDLLQAGPEEIRERMTDLEVHAEDRRQLVSTIEAAVGCFEIHLQPHVVELALWFIDETSPAFWTMLTAPGSRVAQVAARCITPAMGPRLVPFAMAALSSAEFRPHVAKVLAAGTEPAFLEEWLRQAWRLAQPKVARGMASVRELACTDHKGGQLFQVSAPGQRHLARWIAATGLPHRDRIELLHEAQQHGPAGLSRAALWALTAIPDDKVTDLLWTVDRPDDPESRLIARRELARRCPLELPISKLQAGSKGDWDSFTAREPGVEVMTFDRFWTLFDGMSVEQRTAAVPEVFRATPLVKSLLARKLTERETTDRVRAIRMITCLGLMSAFDERLYQLCHDPAPEVRSAAVSAIAPLGTAVSKRLLRAALDDRDKRVQANAVEAVAESDQALAAEELMAKLSSGDNRVQANAVKALLKLGVREAAETLLRMLADDNRMQRISALWLVDRMGLFALASRVAGMATVDPDPMIRQRAATLTRNLDGSPSTNPRGPAVPGPRHAKEAVR